MYVPSTIDEEVLLLLMIEESALLPTANTTGQSTIANMSINPIVIMHTKEDEKKLEEKREVHFRDPEVKRMKLLAENAALQAALLSRRAHHGVMQVLRYVSYCTLFDFFPRLIIFTHFFAHPRTTGGLDASHCFIERPY